MTQQNVAPQSYGSRLTQLAREQGEKTALIFAHEAGGETQFSYKRLESYANKFARYLQMQGVGQNSLVVMAMRNCPELVATCLATWKLGGCTLPLNAKVPQREREELFAAAAESGRSLYIIADHPWDGVNATRATLEQANGLDDSALPDRTPQPGKSIGSGGSTGRAKIIVDPRPWAAMPLPPGKTDPFGRRADHIVLLGGPLYHNGPFGPLFGALFDGTTVVLMERFSAQRAVELIERYKVGWTFMVPTQMARIVQLPDFDPERISSLQGLYHSGAFCHAWLKKKWIDMLGAHAVFEIFGSAEQVGATFMRGDEWLAHPGTVGRGVATDIRILDSEGRDLPTGEVGEIYLRWKPSADGGFLAPKPHADLMYSYWGSPRMKSTPEGFASAGDLGWLDSEGYLHLADRRTDLIITGGSNVYPAEVEDVVSRFPGVVDVAVIGLPDEEWGHRVHAVVETAPGKTVTSDDLLQLCKDNLSYFKVPKAFEFVQQLPRDESGKIRRSQLVLQRKADVAKPN